MLQKNACSGHAAGESPNDTVTGLLPALRLVCVFVLLGPPGWWFGRVGGLGRSRAQRCEPTPRVTFDKLAGIDEVKDEVVEIVDFLSWGRRLPAVAVVSSPWTTGR